MNERKPSEHTRAILDQLREMRLDRIEDRLAAIEGWIVRLTQQSRTKDED